MDAEILIKKLLRSGKHAQIWPEKSGKKKSKNNNNNNQKHKDQKDNSDQKDAEDEEEENLADQIQNAAKNDDGKDADDDGGDSDGKEGGESDEAAGESVGGGASGGKKKKKKKKKKSQNANNSNNGGGAENRIEAPAVRGGSFADGADLALASASMPLPIHHLSPYPSTFYQPHVQGLSYNMNFSNPPASYFAPPKHSYSYSHHPELMFPPHPPSDPIDAYSDDDHESGYCSIM